MGILNEIASRASPYARLMRLHQPTGIWLLLWPCWWGAALAWPQGQNFGGLLWLMLLFLAGATAMRGAGCIVNDMADRRIDAQVARTRMRPLASGELSLKQGFGLLAALLAVGLAVAWQLPRPALWLACASLPLVIAYPFMKRLTHWPQAWLGVTFNWGTLVGAMAASGALDASAWLLYAACIFWTLGYDTIYACQDAADDRRIGVKSTALRLERGMKPWIAGFYAAMLALLAAAGWGMGWGFWLGWAALGAHLAWQVTALKPEDGARCKALFRSNGPAGWLLWLGMVAG